MASRHLARSIAMQSLYELDFHAALEAGKAQREKAHAVTERNVEEFGPGLEEKAFVYVILEGVLSHKKELDTIIEKAAPEWPIGQIAVVDRNVLRIGLFELLFGNYKEVPPKVAINEAIELAKTFGGENSGRFVNGVLGTVYREMGEPGKNEGSRKELTPDEMKRLPLEEKVGAVVYRKERAGFLFALVHDVFGYWTLAKGGPEKGEELAEAVVRKVKEEIGIRDAAVETRLGENQYVAHDPEKGRICRRVTYFLLETEDVKLTLKQTGGLDDVRWFREGELGGLKMYEDVKGFFKKAIGIINNNASTNNESVANERIPNS